jgi:prophage DNA circulation protein
MRTKEIFKNYPFAEEISDWMAIGVVMDSSPNFGKIYLGTLRKLNENPKEVLNSLEKEIKNLSEKDSFIRNMFLNLANNLKVTGQEKINFYGPEIARTIKLDDKGNLTEDSMNITNSMEFLKKYAKSDKDALKFAKRALELNGSDPKTKQELMIRIKSYFPQIVDELNRN